MFNESKNALEKRNSEIETMISILPSLNVDKSAITKASIILMIYNMVEGVFSLLLQEFFEFLSEKKNDFEKFPNELQLAIIKYHIKQIKEDPKALLDFWKQNYIEIPLFTDYRKDVEIFSGNLDACRIREILKKLKITFTGTSTDKNLLYIKNLRNRLAHGEIQFSYACRDKTDKEIKEYMNSARSILTRVIKAFEDTYSNMDISKTKTELQP